MVLSPARTQIFTLLGRHLLPSVVVIEHALALFRRQTLEVLITLHQPLLLIWWQCLVARIVLSQLVPLIFGELPPLPQGFEDLLAFARRQRSKLLITPLRGVALLGRHLLPLLII